MARVLDREMLEGVGQMTLPLASVDYGRARTESKLVWNEELGKRIWRAAMSTARNFNFHERFREDFAARCRERIYIKVQQGRFRYWSGVETAITNQARDFIKELGAKKRAPTVEIEAVEEIATYAQSDGPTETMIDIALAAPFVVCIHTLTEAGWDFTIISRALNMTEPEIRARLAAEQLHLNRS